MPRLLLARRSGAATVDETASDGLTIIGQPAEYGLPQVQMGTIAVSDQGADTGGPPQGLANVAKRSPAEIMRPRGRDVPHALRRPALSVWAMIAAGTKGPTRRLPRTCAFLRR